MTLEHRDTPLFNQMMREFVQKNGRTYESLTKDGPIMLRRVPEAPKAVVRPLSEVPFHERWLEEKIEEDVMTPAEFAKRMYDEEIAVGDAVLKESEAFQKARAYQQSMIDRIFSGETERPVDSRIEMKKGSPFNRSNGYTPKYVIEDEFQPSGEETQNLTVDWLRQEMVKIAKESELHSIAKFFEELVPKHYDKIEGEKVRVTYTVSCEEIQSTLCDNPDGIRDLIEEWRHKAFMKFHRECPKGVITEVTIEHHSGFEDSYVAILSGILPSDEYEKKLTEELKNKVREIVKRDPNKAHVTTDEKFASEFQETMRSFMEKVEETGKQILEEHPGAILTDVSVAKNPEGEPVFYIEGLAPKNPEDAEALKELARQAETSPFLKGLIEASVPKQPSCYAPKDEEVEEK